MPGWNELFKNPENRWKKPFPAVMAFKKRYSKAGRHLSLDLGCGAGRHMIPLQQGKNLAVGMDLSLIGLGYSQILLKKKRKPALLVQADMAAPFPFANESFTELISVHVIFHNRVERIRFTLSEIYRVLKPGGMIFITFNSVYSFRFGMGVELEPGTWIPNLGVDQGIPHHFCSLEDLASLMAGFKVIKVDLDEENSDGNLSSHWLVTAQKPE